MAKIKCSGPRLGLKLYSSDELLLLIIKEKHSFESHKRDICYAGHQYKGWLNINGLLQNPDVDDKTITLSQLKKIIDKQLKVK